MRLGSSRVHCLAPVAFALLLGGSGCIGSSPVQDPTAVLRAYAGALEQGRADDAYRLLSDDARRGTSLEAFRRMVKDDPDQVRDIGRSLARPTAPPIVTAKVVAPDGQELDLVLEKGAWRIDATAIELYAQDTPRHAVQGFVRALERKRYDVILRYVPDGHKEGIDAVKLKTSWEGQSKDEMEQVLSSLKQALPGAKIEETGDHATLAYGAGTMQLVREHGLWKIEDFD
jgi:hypothetical protein